MTEADKLNVDNIIAQLLEGKHENRTQLGTFCLLSFSYLSFTNVNYCRNITSISYFFTFIIICEYWLLFQFCLFSCGVVIKAGLYFMS